MNRCSRVLQCLRHLTTGPTVRWSASTVDSLALNQVICLAAVYDDASRLQPLDAHLLPFTLTTLPCTALPYHVHVHNISHTTYRLLSHA